MLVKDRIIRFEQNNHSISEEDCFIIDEYGIKDGEIYHRKIAISEITFGKFEKKPDHEIRLDEFLAYHGIDSEWEQYELNTLNSDYIVNGDKDSVRLFTDMELEKILNIDTNLNAQTRNKLYQKLYDNLSQNDTLINNPLILDVFNEALKADPELAIWESVYPFFR